MKKIDSNIITVATETMGAIYKDGVDFVRDFGR